MKLKSCPLCGNKAKIYTATATKIWCSCCGLTLIRDNVKAEQAIVEWNRRELEKEVLKAVEFIREMAAEDIRLGNDDKTSLHDIEANARKLVERLS